MRSIVVFIALSLLPGTQASAVLGSATDDAHLVLRAVIANRERLLSGQVLVEGRRVQPSITGKPFECRVSIKYEYDFPASLLRIDWDEPVQRLSIGNEAIQDLSAEKLQSLAKSREMQVERRLCKYIHTPQYSLHWNSDEKGIVWQHDPEHEPDQSLQRFDIRALGFMGSYDFEHGTSLGSTGKNLLEQKVVDFAALNSLQRITWVFGANEEFKREILIDREHGDTSRHFEVRQRANNATQWERSPLEAIDVTWKEVSGAWLPATYVQRSMAGMKIDSQLELKFDWKLVNSPIDENDFTCKGLDLEVKAQVVSDQSDKRIIVGYAYPRGQEKAQIAVPNAASDFSRYYGKEPPALQVTDAYGADKKVKLSDYRGKWLLIDFWSLDCQPCIRRSLPDLAKFYAEHTADRDRFEILAICATEAGKASTKEEFEKVFAPIVENTWHGKSLPFPVLIDGGGKTTAAYGVSGFPATMLIDPDGHVVKFGDETVLAEKLKAKP